MKAVFIEIREFTDWVSDFLPNGLYAKVQQELIEFPDKGAVMPGCGGLRKLRVTDPRRGKGKRGGARIIYLHLPEVKRFYMLDIYGKDEKDDLAPDERKALRGLAEDLKREVRRSVDRRKGEGT